MGKKLFWKIAIIALLLSAAIVPAAHAVAVTQWSWDATTTNTNGTAVDGPVSYAMSCGTTSGVYTIISSPVTGLTMQLSTVLGSQTNGIYYCVVQAIDIWGTKSGYSNEVMDLKTSTGFFAPSGNTPKAPGTLKTS